MSDPQVLHNGMVTTLDDPGVGPVTQMGVPIRLSETPGRVAGPRPAAPLAAKDLPVSALAHRLGQSHRAETQPIRRLSPACASSRSPT